jgi:hypothetical protein
MLLTFKLSLRIVLSDGCGMACIFVVDASENCKWLCFLLSLNVWGCVDDYSSIVDASENSLCGCFVVVGDDDECVCVRVSGSPSSCF